MKRVHKEYIKPGMLGMQERSDALLYRLERLELSHRQSSETVGGLLPKVEDFLKKFTGSNETQLATLSKGLGDVGAAVAGLLARQEQPQTSQGPAGCSEAGPEIVRLQREVESLRRATENLPQAYLKLKNDFQTWGGRVESMLTQLKTEDRQGRERFGGGPRGVAKRMGGCTYYAKERVGGLPKSPFGESGVNVQGYPQEVVSLVGGVKSEVERRHGENFPGGRRTAPNGGRKGGESASCERSSKKALRKVRGTWWP